jgi:hypothetical protein
MTALLFANVMQVIDLMLCVGAVTDRELRWFS